MTNLPQNQKKKKKKWKEKKNEIERDETHAVKWNKRWRAITYHEMTLFIFFKCNKEGAHEIFPEAATGCVL